MSAETDPQQHFQITRLAETETSIRLQITRAEHETVVFTYTPPYKVELDFPGNEATKPPEHPAITIEGNPAFKHKLENGKYLLRLAYHPNPKNTGEALFYNIVASGEKAQEFYGLYITDTRMQLHITGDLIAGEKGRTAGTIRAESIEKIQGRKASAEILHEKVRLNDLP